VFSLLARDVLHDGVLATWEGTFQPYAKTATWEHRYPPAAGNAAGYPTLDQINEAKQADILHLTCHGGVRDANGGDLYWTLDHMNRRTFDYRITAEVAAVAQLGHRPLVFGNACASTATKPADLGALHGFGASFMVGGALNFVGTFAPITNDTAVAFAARFYQHLFGAGGGAGLPVAEALLATKQRFFNAGHADPSYLFYCLYGPPDTTYQPS
jgi:CHAT domain-containing protein